MKKRLVSLLFANIILASLLYSQDAKVHLKLFIKDKKQEEYKNYDEKFFKDTVLVSQYLDKTKNQFIAKNYIAASYDSIIQENGKLKAYLNLHEKYKWNELNFNIDEDSLTCKKRLLKSKKRHKYFSKNNNLIDEILTCYENHGYPFCSVNFDSIEENNGAYNANIIIDKGDKITFDSIIIKGDINLNDKFLYKYLNFSHGSLYSETYVKNLVSILSNSRFLNLAKMPELSFDANNCDIGLYLTKKNSSSFSGIIGILPDNKTQGRILLTGDVDLFLENMIGRGENLSLKWVRYEAQSQHLQTSVYYPYILNSKIGIQAGFDLQKQDSSFVNLKSKAGIRYLFFAENGINVFYEYFSSFPIGNTGQDINFNYGKVNNSQIGLGLINSKLDNQNNPYKGYFINSEISTGLRNQFNDGNIERNTLINVRLDASFYIPIIKNLSFHEGIKFGGIYSENLFENELIFLGGLQDLRGFDENSIKAKTYAVLNSELRYLFEQNSALFIFYDYAMINNLQTQINKPIPLMGFGAGINIQTRAGIFSLVYALGSQEFNPIDMRSSKIHFGYLSRF